MANYANGKIYKIVGEDGSTYYGSTVQNLRLRKNEHRSCKGTTAHQKIISQMDWKMILVENYPCESKKELELREAWYIRGNPCVNKYIPGRTKREYMKKYSEEHSEKINAYQVEYRKKHHEETFAYQGEYRKKHYEKRLTYAKIRDSWIRSFGSIKYENNLQRCDYMLFQ
tara:strand:- start:316 stop:825 length:510 start_codon:yes stop_codon:yes gene_type:complete